jgi:uncharacterized protein
MPNQKQHIKVERPSPEKLKDLRITSWPIWEKEPSSFDWHYDEKETCLFLEGEVTVKSEGSEVKIKKGDLVEFPKGLSCTWHVEQAVRKHYKFGE